MHHARGACCAVISADLQDPPELLPDMYAHWLKGQKLVIAHRAARNDGLLTDLFARIYHRLMRRYVMPYLPPGGFDVVLFDDQLRVEIVKMNEKNTNTLFLLPYMGFEPVYIPYERQKRSVGKSRWTLAKKVKLFVDSFTAFSYLPIRLISFSGMMLGLVAMLYALFLIVCRLFNLIQVQGWTALMVVLLFVSSFQMIATGIVGEYVWRTLDAARHRPVFIVEKVVDTTEI
jgi:dolichol-phosphate mannosyltransferase